MLGWLLVGYPVLTLPILIRYLSLSEDVQDAQENPYEREEPRLERDQPRGFRRPRAEDLWRAEQSLRTELPVAAPSSALTLNPLLDVLEEVSRIETAPAQTPTRAPAPARAPAAPRSRGIDPYELEQLLRAEAEPAVADTVSTRSLRPVEAPARRPDTLSERRDRRTREAARRVAGNPRMQRWVRSAARELLARTGTEG